MRFSYISCSNHRYSPFVTFQDSFQRSAVLAFIIFLEIVYCLLFLSILVFIDSSDMIPSKLVNKSSNEYSKHDVMYDYGDTNNSQRYERVYGKDNSLEYRRELQEHIEYVLKTHGLFIQNLKSFITQLSADAILDLIKEIYQFKTELDDIQKTAHKLQQQLQEEINEDKQALENQYLENDIENLRKDIDHLKLELEQFTNYNEKKVFEEQQTDINGQTNNVPETIKSRLVSLVSTKKNKLFTI